MHPETFITQNIIRILVADGVPESDARGGASAALDYYRRSSQSSKKGRMFDDLLHEARRWVQFRTSKSTRGKRKDRKGCLL